MAGLDSYGELDLCFRARSRTKATPRFSSEVRSVAGVTTCKGLPDSRPSQAFNWSGVAVTNRPCSTTGIPSPLQRFTTESGSPKKSEIAFQPFSICGGLACAVAALDRLGTDMGCQNRCGGEGEMVGLERTRLPSVLSPTTGSSASAASG